MALAQPFGVPQVAQPPRIDGHIDAVEWAAAPVWQAFVQHAPQLGAAPTRRTELRMLHDGHRLYVAVRADEPEPAQVGRRSLRRDIEALAEDDHVLLVLDPQGSGRHGFFFLVNALGAQRDGLIFDGSKLNSDWDGVWDSAATLDEQGWSVELALSLNELAAPADGRPWRFNVERFVAATGERARLFGAVAGVPSESLAAAGALHGVVPQTRGWGLRLQPSLRGSVQRSVDGAARLRLEPGLDVFYRLTPTATAAATLNTDFADAEADKRDITLSRFEVFRPEKRAFFNQDAGRFAFGGLEGDKPTLLPFFSRRIGLAADGSKLPLDVGLKVAGSLGALELGALSARVRRPDGQADLASVLRLAGALSASQRLGFLATQGHRLGTSGSSLTGVDYQLRRTDLWDARTVEAYAWTLASRNPVQGVGRAHGASLVYPNVGPIGAAYWQQVDSGFEPGLGYVERTGVRRLDLEGGWWHRTAAGGNVIPRLFVGGTRGLDGQEQSHYIGQVTELKNAQGDYLKPEAFVDHDRVAAAFQPLPGVTVLPGTYRWVSTQLSAGWLAAREWTGTALWRAGGYYEGRLVEHKATLQWRPSAHWSVVARWERAQMRLSHGAFTARTEAVQIDHALGPRTSHGLLIQRSNITQQTAWGWRSRWLLTPDCDALLVWDRVQAREALPSALSSLLSVKLSWRWLG